MDVRIQSTMSDKDECAVCLESNAKLLKLSPCYHECVCVKCLPKFDLINGFSCPICRAKVSRFFFYAKDVIESMCIDSTDLFQSALTYVSCLNPQCKDKDVCLGLSQIATSCLPDATFKTQLQFPALSVVQVNSLLCLSQAKLGGKVEYLTQRALVSMCKFPWNVEVGLANVGVCYHGNLGEEPASTFAQIELICNNWRELRSCFGTFMTPRVKIMGR